MDPGPQLRLRLKIQVKCFYCWFMKNIYFTGCHRKHHTKLEKLDTKLGVFKETVSNSICICVFVFVPAVKRLFWAILDQHCLFTGTPVPKNTSVNYWPSPFPWFISSVRSSSGYHGLLHINPVFQIFQILQILKWKWKWKDPTCAIFFKSMGFKDIEYDIPVYQM